MEGLREREEPGPLLGLAQLLDLLRDRLLQGLDLGAALLGALGVLDLAGHRVLLVTVIVLTGCVWFFPLVFLPLKARMCR